MDCFWLLQLIFLSFVISSEFNASLNRNRVFNFFICYYDENSSIQNTSPILNILGTPLKIQKSDEMSAYSDQKQFPNSLNQVFNHGLKRGLEKRFFYTRVDQDRIFRLWMYCMTIFFHFMLLDNFLMKIFDEKIEDYLRGNNT